MHAFSKIKVPEPYLFFYLALIEVAFLVIPYVNQYQNLKFINPLTIIMK